MAAKKRRKQRTSIRTAAGVAQEKFLERVRDLADNPHCVLPECPNGEPKPIAKVRAGIDKIAAGKVGFLAKRDKGIVGAVANSLPLAKLSAVPRMLDQKIAGKRRFFVQRGHVGRGCMLGVQNHDEPRALLVAYRDMAKAEGLHFFAGKKLWCTGATPQPPEEWVKSLAKEFDVRMEAMEGGWRLGKDGPGHVRLIFREGPFIDIDPRSVKGHVHQAVAARYAGPRQRHPVEIRVVLPDGTEIEPERDPVASYRAGVIDEGRLADTCIAAWRQETRDSGGRRYVLKDQDFGDDQEAFIDALNPEDWERDALTRITADGFVGKEATTADVSQRRRQDLAIALGPLLGDAAQFVQAQAKTPARHVVRLAIDEAEARARVAKLPAIHGGPEVTAIDAIARAYAKRGKPAAVQVIKQQLDAQKVASGHLNAFATALDDVSLQTHWSADDKATGQALADAAKEILTKDGDAYREAVGQFLRDGGSADTVT